MPKSKHKVTSGKWKVKRTFVIFLFALLTLTLTLAPSVQAVHQTIDPAPGTPPAPRPCFNPEVADDKKLTDNFITDDEGDPPGDGPDGIEQGLGANPNAKLEALKFTATRNGYQGELPIQPIVKNMNFRVNFSRLQALFGANNSNYAEGLAQDKNHAAQNVAGLPNVPAGYIQHFNGALQKTTPKVMTDALRENYVKYVWEKPEIAESLLEFTDIANSPESGKNVYQLVEEYGLPKVPKVGDVSTDWQNEWGKYWEKIPTAYDEFYIGKLEFRAYLGQRTIEQLKGTDEDHNTDIDRPSAESLAACNNFTLLRTVEFPVPRFFRTSQTNGVLNQMLLPNVAQSEQNTLIDITAGHGAVAGLSTSAKSIVQSCFELATNNPISKVLKKAIKVSFNKLIDSQTAHARHLSGGSHLSVSVDVDDVTFDFNPDTNDALALIVYRDDGSTAHDSGSLGTRSSYDWNNVAPGGYRAVVFAFGIVPFSNEVSFSIAAPSCSLSTTTVEVGQTIRVNSHDGLAGEIRMAPEPLPSPPTSVSLGSIGTGGGDLLIPTTTTAGYYQIRGPFGVLCGYITVTVPAPGCTITAPAVLYPGDKFTVNSINSLVGEIQIKGALWLETDPSVNIGYLSPPSTETLPIPNNFKPGTYAVRVGGFAVYCGDVNIAHWTLDTPTFSYGGTVNFTISPAPTAYQRTENSQMRLLVYRADPRTTTQNIIDHICIYDLTDPEIVFATDVTSSSVSWTPGVLKGEFFAVLAKGTNFVSTSVFDLELPTCFQTRFQLEVTVSGNRPTFTWQPPVHVKNALDGVSIIITNLDSGRDIHDSLPLDIGTTTWTAPRITVTGNYRACLSRVASGVWDNDQLTPPIHACTTFEIDFFWPWVSAPLDEDSCIKLFKEGKAGNAPYCAIYNLKFDPPAGAEENPILKVNVIPGECKDPGVDQYRLNDQTNVECNFTFGIDSNVMEFDSNPSSLKMPVDSNGNRFIEGDELGPWDECEEIFNPADPITCHITINVWPNFRIPFLSQIWNNTLYSDVKETLPTLQQTNRPGWHVWAQKDVVQKFAAQDPLAITLQGYVNSCKADPPTTADPTLKGCTDLVNWAGTGDIPTQYQGLADCITGFLLDTPRMVTCLTDVTISIIAGLKNLPGQVNDGSVGGINTNSSAAVGQVLAENTGQKERFVGAVECSKHLTRDVVLKPKVMQKALGVEIGCDLTASTDATDPQTLPDPTSPPSGSPYPSPSAPPAVCRPISNGNPADGIETSPEELRCYISRIAFGKTERRTGIPLAVVMLQVMEAESHGDQCSTPPGGGAGEIGVFQYIAGTWKTVGWDGTNTDSGTHLPPSGNACWGSPGSDPIAVTPPPPSSPNLFNWVANFGVNLDGDAWNPYHQIDATATEMEVSGGCPWSTFKVIYPAACP